MSARKQKGRRGRILLVGAFALRGTRLLDPTQAGFWEVTGRPLTRDDTEPYGVEFLTSYQRLEQVRRRYPIPTVIDIGNGIVGALVGLVYMDDDTGRAVAYAPPPLAPLALLADYRRERRQRGLCPVCGERVSLTGNTRDGRYIATCGDAITPRQWREQGPRRCTPPRRDEP
jgi:hypothetical protein